jgi:transcription elongation factor Elf1
VGVLEMSKTEDISQELKVLTSVPGELINKEPPHCKYCPNDDLSLMTIEHKNYVTTIYCDVCGKTTIIKEK